MSTLNKLYHNPRCSKSRQALALLEDKGVETEIVLYLKEAPTASAIKKLLGKLKLPARELLRKNETLYKSLSLDNEKLDESALIEAMANNPILIERPIFETEESARVGRPPENVLEII